MMSDKARKPWRHVKSFAAGRDYAAQQRRRRTLTASITTIPLFGLLALSACSPVLGYPDNWGNDSAKVTGLEASINTQTASYYSSSTDAVARRALRNSIVYDEMEIYEINFSVFSRRLWGDSNIVSAGGDLAVLALAGLGATSGSTVTKSALAAASAGIVGAQAAISKDLYYQRTLPALLAQISANRDKVKATIYDALNKEDDATYPLARAEIDLQVLQRASGIADAIENITQDATKAKTDAAAVITGLTILPPDVEIRREAFSKYIAGLVKANNKAKLDSIAKTLGLAAASDSKGDGVEILIYVVPRVNGTNAASEMTQLSSLMFPETGQNF